MKPEIKEQAKEIQGLEEHLEKTEIELRTGDSYVGSRGTIIEIATDPEKQVAAYIIDYLNWGCTGDPNMSAIVCVYTNKKTKQLTRDRYRHPHLSSLDNWDNYWHKIIDLKVEEDKGYLTISSETFKDGKVIEGKGIRKTIEFKLPL